MSGTRIQDVWLGADDPWRPWVKQALLSPRLETLEPEAGEAPPWLDRDLSWLGIDEHRSLESPYRDRTTETRSRTAILVDLPGGAAMAMGLALGHAGWRPVLSINATSSEHEVVDMRPIFEWLEKGARFWSPVFAAREAPPVFILDARRDGRGMRVGPGRFDNRWTVYASDLPSGTQLRVAEIDHVVVVQESIKMSDDIEAIAWAYTRAGLDVRVANTADKSIAGMPGRPRGWLGFTIGQLARRWGLRRRWDGSYGHRIPIPPQPSHG